MNILCQLFQVKAFYVLILCSYFKQRDYMTWYRHIKRYFFIKHYTGIHYLSMYICLYVYIHIHPQIYTSWIRKMSIIYFYEFFWAFSVKIKVMRSSTYALIHVVMINSSLYIKVNFWDDILYRRESKVESRRNFLQLATIYK